MLKIQIYKYDLFVLLNFSLKHKILLKKNILLFIEECNKKWIEKKGNKLCELTLIYRGSRDGFTAKTFH